MSKLKCPNGCGPLAPSAQGWECPKCGYFYNTKSPPMFAERVGTEFDARLFGTDAMLTRSMSREELERLYPSGESVA
jgi:hypothetical protein